MPVFDRTLRLSGISTPFQVKLWWNHRIFRVVPSFLFPLIMVTMHIAHNNRPDPFTCSSHIFILHILHAWPLLFVHLSGHVCYLIISPFLSCLRCMRVCVCVCSGYVCLVSVGSIGTRTPPFTPSTFNCFLADSHICAAARFWLRLTRLRTGYV